MKEEVWEAMLNADFNARYWKSLANRFAKREQGLKVFLAVMASTTVASWNFWEDIPELWKALSGFSALISICLPLLNWTKKIEVMSTLSGKWGELQIEYEDLWASVKNGKSEQMVEQSYKKFRKIQKTLVEKEVLMPEDKALAIKCQKDVLRSRNL